MRAALALGLVLGFAAATHGQVAELPELDEPKPYSVDGFIELRPAAFWFDPQASLYALRFPTGNGARAGQVNTRLQGDLSYRKGILSAVSRTVLDVRRADDEWASDVSFYEAYVSVKPGPSFTLDIGKKTLKWGKGYIWNPVAFLDRPKDPDDPALAQEGVVVASADFIASFEGVVRTLALTPVLVPIFDGVNESFGRTGTINAAGRMYLLVADTDVDVTFITGPGRPDALGIDFSRNLASNVEVHGEAAFVPHAARQVVDATGAITRTATSATSMLLGVRYLAPTNTTFIVDMYRNGRGYGSNEIDTYFGLVETGREALAQGDGWLLSQARAAADLGYTRPSAMRAYVYTRVSQPDAFGVLYLNAAVSSIWNLQDGSGSLLPELTYRAGGNLEIRSQVGLAIGPRHSEFGEKQSDLRAELRARFYF